jgi:hypothetical protein
MGYLNWWCIIIMFSVEKYIIVKIIEALLCTSQEVSLGVNVEKMLIVMSVDVTKMQDKMMTFFESVCKSGWILGMCVPIQFRIFFLPICCIKAYR